MRVGNKGPAMAGAGFARLFGALSKQALIDTLWCASQLGTNDQEDQIMAQAARNAEIALAARGDRLRADMQASLAIAAKWRIDSDPEDPTILEIETPDEGPE